VDSGSNLWLAGYPPGTINREHCFRLIALMPEMQKRCKIKKYPVTDKLIMTKTQNFRETFERLKQILKPYEENLTVKRDGPEGYSLDTPYSEKYKKELFFGAVKINKNYVSFHLMPVYMFPGLLDGLSPALKKRMQGKSCFNFTPSDEPLLAELSDLTRRGVERFRNG
jgi:hypothetical protein